MCQRDEACFHKEERLVPWKMGEIPARRRFLEEGVLKQNRKERKFKTFLDRALDNLNSCSLSSCSCRLYKVPMAFNALKACQSMFSRSTSKPRDKSLNHTLEYTSFHLLFAVPS